MKQLKILVKKLRRLLSNKLLLAIVLISASLFAFGDPVKQQVDKHEFDIAEQSIAISNLQKTVNKQAKEIEQQKAVIDELRINLAMYSDQLQDVYRNDYEIESKLSKLKPVKYKLIREE